MYKNRTQAGGRIVRLDKNKILFDRWRLWELEISSEQRLYIWKNYFNR